MTTEGTEIEPVDQENGTKPQNGNGTETAASGEPENFRKIFVGGLTSNTTDEMMREFYGKFGELTDVIVMRDPTTKRSRGFGFITFTSKACVDAAMAARPHTIDGKQVDPKRAVPKDDKNRNESNVSTKRLYVSGIREEHTEQMLTDYFKKFGNVVKSEIILDKATSKPRGFGFVSFDDYDPVDQCVLQRSHMISGYRCDVKKGLSKDEMNKQQQRDMGNRQGRSRGPDPRAGGGAGGQWQGQGRGGGQNWGAGGGGGGGYANYGGQGGWGGDAAGSYGAYQGQQWSGGAQNWGAQAPGAGGQQGGGWGHSGQQQWANAQHGGGRY
ncbi:hypothetical protein WR25_09042 isoform D [Diploscapter pachys]|uniref:RRM domain-containing protein n=2 Tax=Diploscapter pachys TaxID=2018661 RepID=A0A2A2K678_9BILA|nr:hypothetical protein WR25_09042 isoform C [Diploscapter pachys]PAV69439.1 hypothetical protein WR25_09042 isoform D [Diploscapter pachys]